MESRVASRLCLFLAALVPVLVGCSVSDVAPAAGPEPGLPELPVLSRFTDDAGMEADAAWSPDGRWITFGANWAGAGQRKASALLSDDIWIMPASGGEARRLTTDPANETYASWSPDGQQLAYTSNRGGRPNVWTLDLTFSADGSIEVGDAEQVTVGSDSVDWASMTSWSPDGEWIAFSSSKQGRDIWAVPARGGPPRCVTGDPAPDNLPSWSPDGKEIAFTSGRSGNADIWVVPAAGGESRQLTSAPVADWAPSWSPDGRWVAFQSSHGDYTNIWMVPAEGGAPVQVTNLTGAAYTARWSPDGSRISFNGGPGQSGFWSIDAGGGEPRQLIEHAERADWSPKGDQIAYAATDSGGKDLWLLDLAAGRSERLTEGGMVSVRWTEVRWSPDGSRIAFAADMGGDIDIWTVPAAGGRPRRVTAESGSEGHAAWSPDSRRLAVSVIHDGNWDVWIVPAAGGTAEPLVDWPTVEIVTDWSPDGKRIALSSERTREGSAAGWQIWLAPVEGGEPLWLCEGYYPYWSPDGKEIAFIRDDDLWKIPAAGGSAVRILESPEREFDPRWSPDGSTILFKRNLVNEDIWIADVSRLIGARGEVR